VVPQSSEEEKVHLTSKKPWEKGKRANSANTARSPAILQPNTGFFILSLNPIPRVRRLRRKKKDLKSSSISDNSDSPRDKREKALLTAVANMGVEDSLNQMDIDS